MSRDARPLIRHDNALSSVKRWIVVNLLAVVSGEGERNGLRGNRKGGPGNMIPTVNLSLPLLNRYFSPTGYLDIFQTFISSIFCLEMVVDNGWRDKLINS